MFIQEGDLLKGMGHNDFGQLANGVMPSMVTPTAPKFGVREVSAGSHSIILMWDGTVWAWGANTLGQLADDTNVSKSIPQRVKLSDGSILKDIESVIATEYNSYYLTESGRVWASSNWSTTGRSELEQIINQDGTPFSGVVKLSAGLGQVVFLMGDGTVWAVGRNNNGQVGDGTTTDRTYPVQVKNSDGSFFTGVKDVSAAGYHTMYLKQNGEVWGAGFNHDGQLGNGTYDSSPFPVQMINQDGTPFNEVVALSGGTRETSFLKKDGTVWAVGKNNYGQLGDGTTTSRNHPVQVTKSDGQPLTSVKSIDSGHYFSVFYLEDGTIWSVGRNDTGQLGDGTTTNRSRAVQLINDPNSRFFQSEIINYSAGGHVLFQLKDGSVWAMGNNSSGQLGDGRLQIVLYQYVS